MATTSDRPRKQARKVKKDLHKLAAVARNSARKNIRPLRATASERYEREQDKVRKAQRSVVRYVRNRPLRSALIAAGVGFICGGIWFRRLIIDVARSKIAG